MPEALTPRQWVAALAFLLGTGLVFAGLGAIALREWRRQREGPWGGAPTRTGTSPEVGATAGDEPNRWWRPDEWSAPTLAWVLLGVLLLAGAWLRIHGIDLKTITHTEGMLPNLPWPPDSWPPARHSFYDTFWWHFHSELHPPAHYLLIWGWTKIFGTGLISLRLPSALFGVGTILVAYGIGVLIHGRPVGLLAAAFVAFNGFHIFNSQYARVYMMGTFLALFSTFSLLRVVRRGHHGRRWELAYVAISWLAVYTQTYFGLVLAVQVVWVAIQPQIPRHFIRRILGLQAMVVMASAPEIAHVLYVRAPSGYSDPNLAFVVDYLLLGFAFRTDITSIPQRMVAAPLYAAFASLTVLLVGMGTLAWYRSWLQHPRCSDAPGPRSPGGHGASSEVELSTKALGAVAAGCALVTLGFVIVALRRNASMAPTIALPFLALGLPGLYSRLRSAIDASRLGKVPGPRLEVLSRPAGLLVLLAFLPTLALFLYAFHRSYLHPRALMMFTTYLLILAPVGTWMLGRHRAVRLPLALALVALHVVSVQHWRDHPSEGRDYRGLAELMNERMHPGDQLFVLPRAYYVTPLFYYLEGRDYTYVTRDYPAAVAAEPSGRVWLVHFSSYLLGPFETTTEEMTQALADFSPSEEVEALRARAQLFVRDPD